MTCGADRATCAACIGLVEVLIADRAHSVADRCFPRVQWNLSVAPSPARFNVAGHTAELIGANPIALSPAVLVKSVGPFTPVAIGRRCCFPGLHAFSQLHNSASDRTRWPGQLRCYASCRLLDPHSGQTSSRSSGPMSTITSSDVPCQLQEPHRTRSAVGHNSALMADTPSVFVFIVSPSRRAA